MAKVVKTCKVKGCHEWVDAALRLKDGGLIFLCLVHADQIAGTGHCEDPEFLPREKYPSTYMLVATNQRPEPDEYELLISQRIS